MYFKLCMWCVCVLHSCAVKTDLRTAILLTPKRCSSGQLYSEGARGTPSGTRRARDKLISVFSFNMGTFSTLFPSLAPPRNATETRRSAVPAS